MERLLSETDAGKIRVKAAEERWVQAAVRRSDAIFAETEEKIENRKRLSRKVLEITGKLLKNYERCYYLGLKELVQAYGQIKKNLA